MSFFNSQPPSFSVLKKIHPLSIFLALSNLSFILLFTALSLNNRLAFDDFYFLANLNDHGILQGTIFEYNNWSTRWASVFLNSLVLALTKKTSYGLLMFGIVNFLLLSLSVFLLMTNLFHRLTKTKQNAYMLDKFNLWLRVNLSVFTVSLLFITTIKIDETWFLLCSSCTYLWSNMMLILGAAWILNQTRSTLMSVIGCLAFIYIGGSSGPVAIISILSLLLFVAYSVRLHHGLNSVNRPIVSRSLLAFTCCLAAFTLLYIGEGNRVRESFFEEMNILHCLLLNIKMTGIIIITRLPWVLPYILLLCLPMIYFGHYFRGSEIDPRWKRKLLWLTLGYGLLIFFYQLSITYKTQDVGAYRALFSISIFTIVYVCCIYFIIGKRLEIGSKWLTSLLYIPILFSSVLFTYHLFTQQGITRVYSQSYDQRMQYIREHKNQTATLELPPLAPSGMLFTAEISVDTSNFVNQHFKKGMGLSYPVAVKMED